MREQLKLPTSAVTPTGENLRQNELQSYRPVQVGTKFLSGMLRS